MDKREGLCAFGRNVKQFRWIKVSTKDLPCAADTPLLAFYMGSKSVYHKGICTSAFIRDFKLWNQPTCPLTVGHTTNIWHIDPTECFSAIKKDKVMFARKLIILHELSQPGKDKYGDS